VHHAQRGRHVAHHIREDPQAHDAGGELRIQGERQRAAKIVPVGQGEIDYSPIFARAAQSGMQHFFVEQDTAPASGDSIAAAKTSFDAIRKVLA